MSNRIIDLTKTSTIVGTESIPGTQQVASSETVAKNVRWIWNDIVDWITSKLLPNYNLSIYTGSSDSQLLPANTAIVGIDIADDAGMIDEVYNVRIGTTLHGQDILADVPISPPSYNGQRIALSYCNKFAITAYIEVSSTTNSVPVAICLETKKIY